MEIDAIEISGVSKKFSLRKTMRLSRITEQIIWKRQRKETDIVALDSINLVVKKGELLGILGLNSAGKTTLLKIMAGILRPTSGVCKINGSIACFLSHLDGFYPDLRLKDNLLVYGALLGIDRLKINQLFNDADMCGNLLRYLELELYKCSSGIQSQAVFMLSTICDRDIMLFDEFSAFTDIDFQKKALTILSALRRKGKTIVISSNNIFFLDAICKDGVLLENGKIVMKHPIKEIITRYESKY